MRCRTRIGAVLLVVSALQLSGCGNPEDTEVSAAATATTEQCVDANTTVYPDDRSADVDSIHGDAGLLELKRLSTLTLAGTVTSVKDDVQYGQDEKLAYTVVTIRPTETLKGSAGDEVQVGFSSLRINGHRHADPVHPVPAVGACGIWFLVRWGKEYGFDGYGSVSNSSELLFDAEGTFTGKTGLLPALEQAEKLGTRDKILGVLRAAP